MYFFEGYLLELNLKKFLRIRMLGQMTTMMTTTKMRMMKGVMMMTMLRSPLGMKGVIMMMTMKMTPKLMVKEGVMTMMMGMMMTMTTRMVRMTTTTRMVRMTTMTMRRTSRQPRRRSDLSITSASTSLAATFVV